MIELLPFLTVPSTVLMLGIIAQFVAPYVVAQVARILYAM